MATAFGVRRPGAAFLFLKEKRGTNPAPHKSPCRFMRSLQLIMKRAKKIALMTPVILAICLFGVVKARQGFCSPPVATPSSDDVIESASNQTRPATLAPGDPEPP